jgi:hypothetical protein
MTSNAILINDYLIKWDELIKKGSSSQVRIEIQDLLKTQRIPRKYRLGVASVLRRLALFDKAISLLYPIVRPVEKKPTPASAEEIVEYASNLIQTGCLFEGRDLLNEIGSKKFPQRDLFYAFSFFSEWDYKSAVPLLQNYVESPLITPYQKSIGEVNLFAALVAADKSDEAFKLRDKLKPQLRDSGNMLLYANCCEIESQLLIQSQNFINSEAHLKEIESLFQKLGEPYIYYIQKWSLVSKISAAIYKKQFLNSDLNSLKEFRSKFHKNSFPEVARDCDNWLAHFSKDEKLLSTVYFGTPWFSYKEKILSRNPWFHPDSEKIIWPLNNQNKKTPHSTKLFFESYDLPFQMLQILFSDFYSQWSTGSLFGTLYRNEYFNPQSSPQKLKQIARRAREFFKTSKIPLHLILKNGKWTLDSKKCFKFEKLPLLNQRSSKDEWTLQEFISRCKKINPNPNTWLSTGKIAKCLRMPTRTCHTYLTRALQNHLVTKKGRFKSTKYRF